MESPPSTKKKVFAKFLPSQEAWYGASIGLIIASLGICLLSAIDLFNNDVSLGYASLYFFLGLLSVGLIGAFLVFFWHALTSIPNQYKWALTTFIFTIYYFFIPQETVTGIALFSFWIIFFFSLAGAATAVLIKRIKSHSSTETRFIPIVLLVIGILGIIILGDWFFYKETPYQSYAMQKTKNSIPQISSINPSLEGPYTVSTLTYSHGTDLHRPEYGKNTNIITETVDGSYFVHGWHGIEGHLRTHYWGFNKTKLPLNGRVWYPEGIGPFPLVILVHGNHEMSVSSDKGYGYLAKLFASHGFITVSIDQNFINGGWTDFINGLQEAPARGWLILEHLNLWRQWNQSKGHVFHQKVDMDKIALIGHSRGGEAIITAEAFNHLARHPDNGNIAFNYNFKIRALAAIAPVEGQHRPGGKKIVLEDIDYFVLQGSQDGDIRSFQGAAQYERINFNEDNYHFKSSLYVIGANHGQFNTLWGKKDNSSPLVNLFDLGKIMPESEQQQIAKVYLTAFLEATLHDNKTYLPLFRDYRRGKSWLPKTLYLNQFADSTYQYVEKEKKGIDLTATYLPGGTSIGKNLTLWKLNRILLREGIPLDTGIFLGWAHFPHSDEVPTYTITLPEKGIVINEESLLILSLADADDSNPFSEIDFSIELVDSEGNVAILSLSDYSYLQPDFNSPSMKEKILDPLTNDETVFQTFEFPLEEAIKRNSEFICEQLHTISLVFDKTSNGTIILNDVAFRQKMDVSD